MLKTLNHVGTPRDLVLEADRFIEREITNEKPELNHLTMCAEHLVHALQRGPKAIHEMEFSVDMAAGRISMVLFPEGMKDESGV